MMAFSSLQEELQTLSCHFTWNELEQDGSGRTVEMNLGDLEEDYEDDECFEVQWCNLKGYYFAKQNDFEKASHFFQRALEKSKTEDQKVVTLSCMAWLAWLSKRETKDSLDKVNKILQGIRSESIPEVMAEKAFALVEGGGFMTEKFQGAKRCINDALKKRPDNVPFMFTKAKCMQKLLMSSKKVIPPEDAEAKEVDQIWQDLRTETIKRNLPNLQAQVSIYYALFLNKVHYDFGQRDKKYAREAEEVGGSNPSVLRKVAQFYIQSAGRNDTSMMDKAEQILQNLLEANPNSYKALSLYGQVLTKIYKYHEYFPNSKETKETVFTRAEATLQKVWKINKQFIVPAVDLLRLYNAGYERNNEISKLVELKNLCTKLLCLSKDREDSLNLVFYSHYALYLKKYGSVFAKMHRLNEFKKFSKEFDDAFATQSSLYVSQEESMSPRSQVQEALRIIKRYQVNQDDELLHKVDIIFQSVQQTLENQEDDVKATFHKSYAEFLDKYSKDLAIYYFKTSLERKPYQIPRFTYDHLEELAREKIASNIELEKSKGIRILKWVQNLKKQNQIGEEY